MTETLTLFFLSTQNHLSHAVFIKSKGRPSHNPPNQLLLLPHAPRMFANRYYSIVFPPKQFDM
jgi:hypothetical protein